MAEDNFYNVVPIKKLLSSVYNLKMKRAENGLKAYEMLKADLEKTCCDVHY
jgi:CheY-like chemotaxis protein